MTRQLFLWIISLLVFFCCQEYSYGQIFDNDFSKIISKKQAYNDIDSLTKWIEEIHPNMYEHICKKDFEMEVSNIKKHIRKAITIRQFYNLITPLLTSIKDAHTELHAPFIVIENRKDLFPIRIHLSNNSSEIILENSVDTSCSQIPNGAKLISINGIKSEKLITELGEQICYETKVLFNARFQDLFSSLLYCRYGFKEKFIIEFSYNNERKKIVVKNQSFLIKSTNLQQDEYSFLIDKNRNIAFLTLNTFGVKNDSDYFIFLKNSFSRLKLENINTLIIDLRNNDGGNSTLGDSLLAYLSPVSFKQYGTTYYKYSRHQKALYTNYYKKSTVYLNELNSKPNGLIEKQATEELIKPNPKQIQYTEKTYLMISNFTFSAAADFAWAFKHYKLGTIVGQETGGLGVCFGDGIPFILPNSQIRGQSSCQKFYNIGAGDTDFHGVIPDISTKENEELKTIFDN